VCAAGGWIRNLPMSCAEASCRLARRFLLILVAVGLCVASAALGDADASELIYSQWEKHCIGADICLVGMDVHLAAGCKPVVAGALLTERTGESKKTLRVGLPNYVRLDDGVRISFDQGPPVRLPFVKRHAYGTVTDYEAGAELVDQLKNATMLVIEATSAAGVPMTYRLPLGGFAIAYDGRAIPAPVFKQAGLEAQSKLQEELLRRQEGLPQPRSLENHKAGCEAESR
jgi:invasion protein IalB